LPTTETSAHVKTESTGKLLQFRRKVDASAQAAAGGGFWESIDVYLRTPAPPEEIADFRMAIAAEAPLPLEGTNRAPHVPHYFPYALTVSAPVPSAPGERRRTDRRLPRAVPDKPDGAAPAADARPQPAAATTASPPAEPHHGSKEISREVRALRY